MSKTLLLTLNSAQFRERTTVDKWKTGVLANIKRKIDARSGANKKNESDNEVEEGNMEQPDDDFDPY